MAVELRLLGSVRAAGYRLIEAEAPTVLATIEPAGRDR
jgi:hypothetical protein